MATHSSIHTWRISQTEEPGGLQSMGWLSQTRLSNQLGVRGVVDLTLKTDPFWKFGINMYTLIHLKWMMCMYGSVPLLFT